MARAGDGKVDRRKRGQATEHDTGGEKKSWRECGEVKSKCHVPATGKARAARQSPGQRQAHLHFNPHGHIPATSSACPAPPPTSSHHSHACPQENTAETAYQPRYLPQRSCPPLWLVAAQPPLQGSRAASNVCIRDEYVRGRMTTEEISGQFK